MTTRDHDPAADTANTRAADIPSNVSASATPAQLVAARYGQPDIRVPAPWSDVIATMLAHRSVRAYRPVPLPEGTLETLVAAAQSAPSSSNLQSWSVIAVTDPARKARLAALASNQACVREAPLVLIWLADLNRLQSLGDDRGRPVEALPYMEPLFFAVIDAALAAQNALVAAESLGLGGVYVGSMRDKPVEVAAELGLPPQVLAVFGMCIGVPDPEHLSGVKPRLAPSVVLHRETYGAGQTAEAVAAYDTALQAFQKDQRIPEMPWSERALKRVESPQSLNGRDALRGYLEAMGFGLR